MSDIVERCRKTQRGKEIQFSPQPRKDHAMNEKSVGSPTAHPGNQEKDNATPV